MSASDKGKGRSRPRLLIVTTVPETLATILAGQPAFLAQHFDVHLATSRGPMFERVEEQEGIVPEVVHMQRGISPLADLRSIMAMIRVMRQMRPDIVHSYTPKAGLVAMLAGWFCRVPVRIHTFTGLIFPTAQGLRQRLLLAVDRLICRAATRIVPEGQGVKQDLVRFRVTDKPLEVIGRGNIAGVDCSAFVPGMPEVEAAAQTLATDLAIDRDGDFVFCFVGRLNQDKGLAELVSAFAGLPEQARLLVVGAMDDTAPPDPHTVETLQAHPRIHLLGFQRDIRPALALSHVLVLPSYREGFPNVVLQAGAMARPVIATDISGCNEVVEPGRTGWLVPVRDDAALAGAMIDAMRRQPDELHRMGQSAREQIRRDFHRPDHWQRMLLFYRGLLDGKPGSGHTP